MQKKSLITHLSAVLLMGILLTSAIAHKDYLDMCVCVVNSLGRSAVTLGISMIFGVVGNALVTSLPGRTTKVMEWIELIAFVTGVFFFVQHILFALEIA